MDLIFTLRFEQREGFMLWIAARLGASAHTSIQKWIETTNVVW